MRGSRERTEPNPLPTHSNKRTVHKQFTNTACSRTYLCRPEPQQTNINERSRTHACCPVRKQMSRPKNAVPSDLSARVSPNSIYRHLIVVDVGVGAARARLQAAPHRCPLACRLGPSCQLALQRARRSRPLTVAPTRRRPLEGGPRYIVSAATMRPIAGP